MYTGSGDDGSTVNADGKRVSKGEARLEAVGTLDEANAHVGFAIAVTDDPVLLQILTFLSHRLLNCSCVLATSGPPCGGHPEVALSDVHFLEKAVDFITERSAPLKEFILSNRSEAGARLNTARTVLRRAERAVCRLDKVGAERPELFKFINRGSDLLFACARYADMLDKAEETRWDPSHPPPELP